MHVRSKTDEGDASATGNLIIGGTRCRSRPLRPCARAPTIWSLDRQQLHELRLVVAGAQNTTSGPYASVSGGAANTASNAYTSVAGGAGNTAESTGASTHGGDGIWLDSGSPYAWQGGTFHTP